MISEVYNINNEKVGEVELPDRLFSVDWNPDLVHFAYEIQRANARRSLAKVKTRGEVAGGGKKPWRQKGTGRARHGSIRSPLWIGGGVTHGPSLEKKFGKKINKKQRQAALFSLLSKRLADRQLKIIDRLPDLELPKTKTFAAVLNSLIPDKASTIIVGSPSNRFLSLSVRNLPKILPLSPNSLNVVDLLNYRYLIIEKDSLPVITKHYLPSA